MSTIITTSFSFLSTTVYWFQQTLFFFSQTLVLLLYLLKNVHFFWLILRKKCRLCLRLFIILVFFIGCHYRGQLILNKSHSSRRRKLWQLHGIQFGMKSRFLLAFNNRLDIRSHFGPLKCGKFNTFLRTCINKVWWAPWRALRINGLEKFLFNIRTEFASSFLRMFIISFYHLQ